MAIMDPENFEVYEAEDGKTRVRRTDGLEVCDFCMEPSPTWQYPAAPMEIVGAAAISASDDEWGACEICHHLIDTSRIDGLVTYSVSGQRNRTGGAVKLLPLDVHYNQQRRNVLRFLDARLGPAVPYERSA